MSSLMQFSGQITEQGVGLLFYLSNGLKFPDGLAGAEPTVCTVCSTPVVPRTHPLLYEVFRKPAGMFGVWVVFRYNGEEHVPDLSIPIEIDRIPRGARKLTQEENSKQWHSS